MYRRKLPGQQKLEIPFGVELRCDNRWVKLAALMPWEEIEEEYSKSFAGTKGQEAKSGRLAFGALYIQNRLATTDEETVEQIGENPAMQYFCGYELYSTEKPFDPSLMVHFRKRISPRMLKEISGAAFAAKALKAIESEKDDDRDDHDDAGGSQPVDKSNRR